MRLHCIKERFIDFDICESYRKNEEVEEGK